VTLFFAGPSIPYFSSSSTRGRTYSGLSYFCCIRSPEAGESLDEDDAEDSLERTSLTTLPPPAHSEDPSLDRKRKRVEELISSSTSASKAAVGEPSSPNEDEELFDLLDSLDFADSKFYLLLASFLLTYVKSLLFIPFAVTTRTRKGKLALLPLLILLLLMNRLLKRPVRC
jgi:hypothetical protein